MSDAVELSADELCDEYFDGVVSLMRRIIDDEKVSVDTAAQLMAKQIAGDRLVHVYGPGGHSNLATQEVFFRAGGLMHINAILDEGTLLSNGALRSMAMERTPGYGRIVVENQNLGNTDLLVLVNAYGINAALIDAALTAREKGVTLIGISSREHADNTAPEHPARHPGKQNLHDLVDVAIDTKVPIGDAIINIPEISESTSAVSTFANAMALNTLIIRTIVHLRDARVVPPIWRSGNAPGGDDANAKFIANFRGRVQVL